VDNVSYAVPNRFLLCLPSSFCNEQKVQNTPRKHETGGNQFSDSRGNNSSVFSEKKSEDINQEQSQESEKATSARKRDPISGVGAVTKVKQL